MQYFNPMCLQGCAPKICLRSGVEKADGVSFFDENALEKMTDIYNPRRQISYKYVLALNIDVIPAFFGTVSLSPTMSFPCFSPG